MSWFARRGIRRRGRLAEHLLAPGPGAEFYGWNTSRNTGLRTAFVYRQLWRWLEQGWLVDGWDLDGRRTYAVTPQGRIALGIVAFGARL